MCSTSPSASPGLELAVGNGSANFITTRFEGGTSTYAATEAFPVTVTSPSPVEVDLSALCVPDGVWVSFNPSHVTASAGGTLATMTIADAIKPFISSDGAESTIFIQAASGTGVSAVPLGIDGLGNGMTVLSSPGPIFLTHHVGTTVNETVATDFGVVYDPSSPAATSPLQVTFAVAGMLLDDGTRVALPDWIHVLLVNSSLSLVPDQPVYFTFAAGVYSHLPGYYRVLINEFVGGKQFTVVLGVQADPPIILPPPT